MLYYLFNWLNKTFHLPGAGLFQFLTFRIAMAVILSLLIATVYGKNAIAVLLSGMGADGAREMKQLKDLGVLTMAQDELSSLVHGMPGEAIRLGAVCMTGPPEGIAHEIIKILKL